MGTNRMKQDFVVLMYHGIYKSQVELEKMPAEERPYAISSDTFKQHLQRLKELSVPVIGRHELLQGSFHGEPGKPGVVITFDDGDKGWYHYVLPLLKEFDYEATFFVTSDLIEQYDHFCDWPQIKALSDAGMNVQSHGQTHRFLSDLSNEECAAEYKNSKLAIEKVTGKPVTEISFPGGCYNKTTVNVGLSTGYQMFFTSEVGKNHLGSNQQNIKRFAIRATTSLDNLTTCVTANPLALLRLKLIADLKGLVKKLLGNMGYHRLYKLLKE
jgi:peptidoglycan/xylan/chitin deacetylase (PgdA/CDA1 family)